MTNVVWYPAGIEHGAHNGVEVLGNRYISPDLGTGWHIRVMHASSSNIDTYFVVAGRFYALLSLHSVPGAPGVIETSLDEVEVKPEDKIAVLHLLSAWPHEPGLG